MILSRIAQIALIALLTEQLLQGLHRFYLTAELKGYLVGKGDGGGVLKGPLREFVRCKFCQSWWVAWAVSLMTLLVWEGWSLHWIWIGIIAGSLANKWHDVWDTVRAMRYLPYKEM